MHRFTTSVWALHFELKTKEENLQELTIKTLKIATSTELAYFKATNKYKNLGLQNSKRK
jgi:hypothetical protein